MNEEQVRQLMMERLYGEIRPEDERALDQALEQAPALAQEWREIEEVHALFRKRPESNAPPPLQKSIQQAAVGVPADRHPTFRWGRWMAAAVIVAACGGAYDQFGGMDSTELRNEFAVVDQQVRAVPPNVELRSTDRLDTGNLSSHSMSADLPAPNESTQLVSAKAHIGHKQNAKREKEAESLFRTGLGVYNQAFTKLGDERTTLLKSAVITLGDVVKRYPEQREWSSMGLTLIADSHRALDDIDAAIQSYEQLIESCAELDEICTQARISMVELLLTQEQSTDEISEHLSILSLQENHADDYATLALTASSRIGESNPEQAYNWARQILTAWPPQHVYHQKARRIAQQYYQQALDQNAIKPWWVFGPLTNYSVQLDDLPPITSTRSIIGFTNTPVRWKKTELGNLAPDLSQDGVDQDAGRTAFLATHIESPENQVVVLALKTNARTMMFVNEELVWKQRPHSNATRQKVECSLKKGQNQIVLKMYFPNGKNDENHFSLTVLDTENKIKHGLNATH